MVTGLVTNDIIKVPTLFDLIFHPVKCLGFSPIILYDVLFSYQGFFGT